MSRHEQLTSQEAQTTPLTLDFASTLLFFAGLRSFHFNFALTSSRLLNKSEVMGGNGIGKLTDMVAGDIGCTLLSVREFCNLGDFIEDRIVFRFRSASVIQIHLLLLRLARNAKLAWMLASCAISY